MLRLHSPLHSSYGSTGERELLAVSITDAAGICGHGEAAPLPAYDGVSVDRVQEALARYGPVLAESEGMNGAQVLDACRQVEDLPPALAAIDLALWDRAGRVRGKPVASLLTDNPARAGACERDLDGT